MRKAWTLLDPRHTERLSRPAFAKALKKLGLPVALADAQRNVLEMTSVAPAAISPLAGRGPEALRRRASYAYAYGWCYA